MQSKKNLAFELQNVLGQLKRNGSFKHGHSKLKGAEKHMLLLISDFGSSDPITISQIANKIGVTLAAVTHQINALEKVGLIKRFQDKVDRRIVFIGLSKKGINQVAKLKKEFAKNIQLFSDFLGEEDTKELIRLIKKISEFKGSKEQ